MISGAKALVWLRSSAVAVFVLALLLGIFLPIYTDEVGWRLHERAGLDGVDKMFTLICGSETAFAPPSWMMPARYYSAIFNSLFPDPFYVRISGILYALVWTGMLLVLTRRVAERASDRLALSTLAIGLMSLGTMPLLLIWSRPEQPIIMAILGAVLIATKEWEHTEPGADAKTAWLRSIAVLFLASIALSYHVKTLIAVPVFFTCLFFAARGKQAKLPRAVVALVLAAISASAAYYWVHRLQCPDLPLVRLSVQNTNSAAAMVNATAPWQFLTLVGKALAHISLYNYLILPVPQNHPMSLWLPAHGVSDANSLRWMLTTFTLWNGVMVVAAGCMVVAVRDAWRERRLDSRLWLAIVLLATILMWSATQGVRNVYEAIFAVPLVTMAVVLVLATNRERKWLGSGLQVVSVVIALAGIVSIGLTASIYGPPLVRSSHERGYVKNQFGSVSPFGFASLRKDAMAAARKCGIKRPDRNHGLLIDDVTYFMFMQSHMPDHSGGLITGWDVTDDPLGYLRRNKSDGIILSCRNLKPPLRAKAKSEGQFCCIGSQDL